MSENNLTIFQDEIFGQIRTIEEGDKVLFCGSDIANSLGYVNSRKAISDHCRCVTKRDIPHPQSNNKTMSVSFITEGDVYRLIAHSKLPTADKFERWVFDEILPTIHKTGGYVNNDELFINTYLPYADENTKNLFRLQLNTITQLNNKIEQSKPLVDFAEQVSSTADLIDIGELSKLLHKQGLNIGRNKLFEWLRDNKFLRPNNEPYQQYINQGYFKTKESTHYIGDKPKITIKTFVTGKGQQYIFDKLSSATIE